MNPIILPIRRPATQATQALHQKLDAIASGVLALQTDQEASARSAGAASAPATEEPRGEVNGKPPKADASEVAATVSKPLGTGAGDTGGGRLPLPPIGDGPGPAATGSKPLATGAGGQNGGRLSLPAVPDLRPGLEALNAALFAQHAAMEQALQRVITLCQFQQRQSERLAREVAELSNRVARMPSLF